MKLLDILSLEEIQDLQDKLSNATGLASIITEPNGTPITKPTNFTYLCSEMVRKTKKGLENCMKSDAIIGKLNEGKPTLHPCYSCGLLDAGAGIFINDQHIANWLIGQVRDEKQGPKHVREYAIDLGLDPDKAEEEFYKVPILSVDDFIKYSELIFSYVNHLSKIAYLNLQQKETINELMTLKEKLEKTEKKSRITLNTIEEGIITLNCDCKILFMNNASEEMTGWSYSEARRKDLNEIFRLEGPESTKIFGQISDSILDMKRLEFIKNCILKDKVGSHRMIIFSVVPNNIPGDEIRGVLTFKDITEESQLNEQLIQSQKMNDFGILASGITHDFNNVINGISMATEILESIVDKDRNDEWEMLEVIKSSAARAKGLTENLRRFSRKDRLEMNIITLGDLLSETVSLLSFSLNKNLLIKINKRSTNDRIMGNIGAIQGLLMNLGINASHAISGKGEIRYSIYNTYLDAEYCISCQNKIVPGEYCVIEVSDTGTGIPKEKIKNIFRPFFTTKNREEGTGIGLSTVLRTVKDHKGDIKVTSKVNEGTTFFIYFPTTIHEMDKSHDLNKKNINHQSNQCKGNILIVDDDEANLALAMNILKNYGYGVNTAETGQNALRWLKENQVDLVLLDMIMPGLDGAATYLKLKERYPDLKVVIITGDADNSRLAEIQELGIEGILKKPYSLENFTNMIMKVLNK